MLDLLTAVEQPSLWAAITVLALIILVLMHTPDIWPDRTVISQNINETRKLITRQQWEMEKIYNAIFKTRDEWDEIDRRGRKQ